MDGPFPLVAQGGGPSGAEQVPVRVVEVPERPVDGTQTVGPAGHQYPRQGRVPLVPRIVGVEAADDHRAGPTTRCVVGHAEVHGLETVAGDGDGLDVGHPEGGLDQRLKTDPSVQAHGRFDLRDHGIHQVNVCWDPYLGDQNRVEMPSGLFYDVDHIPIHVVGVNAVDPHRDGLAPLPPVDVAQGVDDVGAGLLLVSGGDSVFEI